MAEGLDGFVGSVVCTSFALEGLKVVCFEVTVGTLIDACLIKVQSSDSGDVSNDVMWDAKLEGTHAGRVAGAQEGDC